MVVLAASICTRGGKPLLSRQFRDLKKDRITALLSDFPGLISNSSSQHTTVENDTVRYVYQPLEEFYIVLLTNKTSNILQDIDTLHLFASTVSSILGSIDEREIFDSAFEIISAFDEIVNLGFKENLTLSQVQTFLEMDSHEEKIQDIIERNKELEATEERKRRAKEIQRKEMARKLQDSVTSGNSMGYDSYQSQLAQTYQPSYQPAPVIEEAAPATHSSLASKPLGPRGGGLQLGKKAPKAVDQSQPLLSNSNIHFSHGNGTSGPKNNSTSRVPTKSSSFNSVEPSPAVTSQLPSESTSPAPSAQQKVHNNGILIIINEKISASFNREGSITQSELKGDLQLRINDSKLSNAKILLKTANKSSGIQYKPHPNVDRNLFNSESVIGLKDKSKSFPSNDQALGVLRWRGVGKADQSDFVPLLVTAWVSVDSNIASVTLEYELSPEFLENNQLKEPSELLIKDLFFTLPFSSHDVDLVGDAADVSYDVTEENVIFQAGGLSTESPQGSFEFSIPAGDEDVLFPLNVQFSITNETATDSDVSLGKLQLIDVVKNDENEEPLPFDLHFNTTSEKYQIS